MAEVRTIIMYLHSHIKCLLGEKLRDDGKSRDEGVYERTHFFFFFFFGKKISS